MSTPTSESQQPVDERGTQVCGCGKCEQDWIDDRRCCTLDPDHEGPCVWRCSTCDGTGECPECQGAGPELCGCGYCDTTGTCPDCGGDGQVVEVVDIADVDATPRAVSS